MRRTILRIGSVLVVAAVSLRVAVLRRIVPLHLLPERLRNGFPLPRSLRDPQRLAAAVDRLGPLLPPWGIGWCLKRSLLLLDLWSRCGLETRLHVGVRRAGGRGVEGHAWLTVPSLGPGGGLPGPPPGEESFVEAWSHGPGGKIERWHPPSTPAPAP